MPLRRTYKSRNPNPQYDPVNSPNVRHQGGQIPNIDTSINSPQQDGDTVIWGNWSWSSPNAVDAISKITAVTDIDDTQYYAVPNFREVMRAHAGAVATGFGSAMAAGGFNIYGGGFTQVHNYINTNSFDIGGALTIVDPGQYMFEISGACIASGGVILNCVCNLQINGVNIINGGSRLNFAAGAGVTQAPLTLKWIHGILAGQSVRPGFFLTLSAGTCALDSLFFKITPLYFA